MPEWENRRKFCSRDCSDKSKLGISSWNKGLKTGLVPKTAFKKGERPSIKTEFKTGLVPWNKKDWYCKTCKTELSRKIGYCSMKCKSDALRKPRPIKECIICKSIITRNYGSDKAWKEKKYCSRKCQFDGQGEHFKGAKNHNYKGGISPLMNQIRGLKEYARWVRAIFRRDNWTCRLCGARNGNGKKVILNADHYPRAFSIIIKENKVDSIEKALNCIELWELNNGRTLCAPCHKVETAKLKKTL